MLCITRRLHYLYRPASGELYFLRIGAVRYVFMIFGQTNSGTISALCDVLFHLMLFSVFPATGPLCSDQCICLDAIDKVHVSFFAFCFAKVCINIFGIGKACTETINERRKTKLDSNGMVIYQLYGPGQIDLQEDVGCIYREELACRFAEKHRCTQRCIFRVIVH